MNSIKTLALACVASSMLLAGCSARILDFTALSTHHTHLRFDKATGVLVSESSNGFLGIGTSLKEAIDNALQAAGPEYDLLVNAVLRQNNYVFVYGWQAEGLAVSSVKIRAELGEEGYQEWLRTHNVIDPKKLAEKQYALMF